MAAEKVKKTFSETRIYPVFFMVIITLIFVGILATFYHLTIQRVTEYRDLKLKETILQLFDLPTQNSEAEFSEFITKREKNNIQYYEAVQDSILLGYCFPIRGKGLWGTIDALIALSADLSQIIKLEIISQNETPGLGGRITENWFKDQFQNKIIINDEIVQYFQLIPEEEKTASNQINQITGATASSKAVADMISRNVKIILAETGGEL